jgi:predicted permease
VPDHPAGRGDPPLRLAARGVLPGHRKFSYNICFPALLFSGTANSASVGPVGDLALAILLPTVLVLLATLLALLAARGLPPPARSSVVQGAVRPNTYFGLAVSACCSMPTRPRW